MGSGGCNLHIFVAMNPTLIAAAVGIAISAGIGFSTAWTLQGRTIDALKIEAKDDIINQQRASRQVAERFAQQVIAAQNAAQARVSRNTIDRSRAADAGSGLRITSETTVRAAATDSDACTAALSAHSVVLSAAITEAERLAETADTWASQAVIFQDAWPKDNFTETPLVK